MKITNKGRYAVRAMLYISCSSELVSVKDVAKDEDLSNRYLEQIFFSLKKSGLVKSKKGPNGGYALAKNERDITVGDILRAVEDKERHNVDTYDSQNLNYTIQKEVWEKVEKKVEDILDSITLEELKSKHYESMANMYYI